MSTYANRRFIPITYCILAIKSIPIKTFFPHHPIFKFKVSEIHFVFLDQVVRVAERLKDSKIFPQVIRPLQIHISDAIMNLQTILFRLDQSVSLRVIQQSFVINFAVF